MRSITEIGNLWPLCKNCKHIAQSHDSGGCSELTSGQCPTCSTWQDKIPCQCKGYEGPTREEFKKLLTAEEISRYGFDRRDIVNEDGSISENDRVANMMVELIEQLRIGNINSEDVVKKLNQYPGGW